MSSALLLGDDGRGYDLARQLEEQGVWRSWLGDDALYSNFVQFLSSPSSWESFMSDTSKSKLLLHLQLRARALLFDKASGCLGSSQPGASSSSSSAVVVSKLNPNYLKLHVDDVYFTLENSAQGDVFPNSAPSASKVQSKMAFGAGSRYGQSEVDNTSQRFRLEVFPETWYDQNFEKYRVSKPYKLSYGDQETDKRTPEQMSTYLRVLERHKRRRMVFKEDEKMCSGPSGNPMFESGSNVRSNFGFDNTNETDDEAPFFPEIVFPANCVPDCALPSSSLVEKSQKVQFNGVLDNLPRMQTKSSILVERLGMRAAEYLNMEQQVIQNRGKDGSDGNRKKFSQQQASLMSRKVMSRLLSSVGFEAASEVPLEVMSQLLSSHITKLGNIMKVLADSYRKQCSAMELIKMFLQTSGHGNLGAMAELVKKNTKNTVQLTPQQLQAIQSQLQSQHQTSIRQSHQVPRQMHQQMQQMVIPLQQQQWEAMRRRQFSSPRPIMKMNMEKERPVVQVKLENPEFPGDGVNTYTTMSSRNIQPQFRQQQLAAMSALHAQSSNQFRQLSPLQVPQTQTQVQSPNMSLPRAPPVKVEGFQELMGGDSSLKHDSEEKKLTSPK